MSSKVFISYRRDDSRYQARIIHAAFCHVVARDNVFMDVASIPPGANFRKILKSWVEQCEVLLALIGPGWIDAVDPRTGLRRLDNPSDFVRIEIGEALARGIPVVPVLLDGAALPEPERLPDDLKELVDRQAELVEYRSFDADVERLIRKLRLGGAPFAPSRPQAPPVPSARSVPPAARGDAATVPLGASVTVPVAATPSPARPALPVDEAQLRAEGRIRVTAPFVHGAPGGWLLPGGGREEWFRDIYVGPEMVIVPAGGFKMGSPESEMHRSADEGPQHSVVIARPFAVGRHAVTRRQFAAFVGATGHKTDGGAYVWKGDHHEHDVAGSWRAPGFEQDDDHPVVCVSWADAQAYVAWLSLQTGKSYRLPTEAEREYVTRAGTTTPYWCGATVDAKVANFRSDLVAAMGGRGATVAAASLQPNAWGLHSVHGNVWEWCADHWHDSYGGAPVDGSAWLTGGDAGRRVVRGGSWLNFAPILRSAIRFRFAPSQRIMNLGFRVARDLA